MNCFPFWLAFHFPFSVEKFKINLNNFALPCFPVGRTGNYHFECAFINEQQYLFLENVDFNWEKASGCMHRQLFPSNKSKAKNKIEFICQKVRSK